MIAVIMAGGSGKRFWPLSRESKPKQFLKINSDLTMIQMTVERLKDKISIKKIFVVTTSQQKQLVKENLEDLPEENIIQEPEGKNTAPAIALSALYISRFFNKDETMIVLPADHIIEEKNKFIESLDTAEKAAEKDNLVIFGVQPTFPATGYGYIEAGNSYDEGFYVRNFKEKPDRSTAEYFLNSGNYYWNSGMFVWKIDTILDSYKKYLPKVNSLLDSIAEKWNTKGLEADISALYSEMPKLPVDIGIMEQAEKRIVIPVNYYWNDVGSWKSVFEISEKDKNNNVISGDNEVIQSKNCYINSDKFIALVGVNNLVAIETDDVLLLADQNKSEKVKDIVSNLEEKGKTQYI